MRLITILAALLAVVVCESSAVDAEVGGGTKGTEGTVVVSAGTSAVITYGRRSLCSWDRLTNREAEELDGHGGRVDWGLDDPHWDDWFQTTINGVLVDGYVIDCPALMSQFRWVDPTVTPGDLIPAIRAVAEDTIALPQPDINPPVTARGYVNLGMWLAVAPASYEPIGANAGPAAWIIATPAVGSTTFDFGNGDTVTCEGFGTPIVDFETLDEGPCGYTYRQPGAYTLTVATTWLLPYTSSDGPGAIAPLTRTSTFDYEVAEIQTVGTGG